MKLHKHCVLHRATSHRGDETKKNKKTMLEIVTDAHGKQCRYTICTLERLHRVNRNQPRRADPIWKANANQTNGGQPGP